MTRWNQAACLGGLVVWLGVLQAPPPGPAPLSQITVLVSVQPPW
jgi:hypothetical protein